MINFISYFKSKNTCNHDKISPDIDCGYCPDCGEFIENQWFIVRCACCGIKEKATIVKGKIIPQSNFCKNCGSNEFEIEKIVKINPSDLHFAVLVKQIISHKTISFIQTWVESRQEKLNKFLSDKIIKSV